jgi:DNA-binding NarL/FixJ family response regulator
VTDFMTEWELRAAVACRVVAVLSRVEAAGDRFVAEVLSAAGGDGTMPAEVLDELLERARRASPTRGPRLSAREVEVLRLMADGWDTADIASQLCYSERTVKNVIYALTSRLKLRSRPHAVAFAMRAGLI